MLAIDYNTDKSMNLVMDEGRRPKVLGLRAVLSQASEGLDIQIYIDTLQPFLG